MKFQNWNGKNARSNWAKIKLRYSTASVGPSMTKKKPQPSLDFTHIQKVNKRVEGRIFKKGLMFVSKLKYTVLTIVFGNLVFFGKYENKTIRKTIYCKRMYKIEYKMIGKHVDKR